MEWNRYERPKLVVRSKSCFPRGSYSTYNDTLLIAMFKVKSVENTTSIMLSLSDSFESFNCPVSKSVVHPREVAVVCANVRSHGKETFTKSVGPREESANIRTYTL